ncbi:steroid receptor-associated and regulated protein [Choloepus didactylus]|uniref:steroid receptor-associated and regulated protein n=1 Tax=Choloepus didactylus TaxID=27675 RepID=UPI00189FF805|nr:steroid receptor-associated and regulated protein [Choloepus didactylus]
MAPAEDPGHSERGSGRASPQASGLETDVEPGPGRQLLRHQKAIPTTHLTFVIDCARGKQISLAAPPGLSCASSPYRGPVSPPMKTFIMFCGESCPQVSREGPLGQGGLAQARHVPVLPPRGGTVAPASCPGSPLCPQEVSRAKESPSKTLPTRSSAWGTVKGSLKALSSCVCGLAD